MKLTPKPWVVTVLKVIAGLLVFVFFGLIVLYFAGLDKRVERLETRPIQTVVKEVKVVITATPSAKPVKRVVPVSVIPSK